MEIFDFSTTAISGLVSVFSAVMGMMYPLLLQAIQQVDDRYRSTRMSKMLLKEKAFVRFQFLLVISVLLALASVFFMRMFSDYYWLSIVWVLLHSIITLLLVYDALALFNLVIVYYNPERLINHISQMLQQTDENQQNETM